MNSSTEYKKKANTTNPKPTRPYSEYNVFFQLEREYILQALLGVKPNIEPSQIFCLQDENYKGSILPSRYRELILPYDWYIPGKARRRNRRHRKSHGKIGFLELTHQIGEAWSQVDDETRLYCASLSDIGRSEYNRIKWNYKKKSCYKTSSPIQPMSTTSNESLSAIAIDPVKCSGNLLELAGVSSTRRLSHCMQYINENIERFLFENRSRDAATKNEEVALVDMSDDDIMSIWFRS